MHLVSSSSPSVLPRHQSVPHIHLFSCLNTLLERELAAGSTTIRILDIGCGNGRLLSYLHRAFRALYPQHTIEVYGFDVGDQGWADSEEFARAVEELNATTREVPWRERLIRISANDPWPFPDGFFDAAISCEVLEHVPNLDHLLAELGRVLKPEGVSVHLLPLAGTAFEGHIMVPFAHWIRDIDVQSRLIEISNRLGIGRWRTDKDIFGISNIRDYADSQAAFLNTGTFYRTFRDFFEACRRHDMALSHRFTAELYFAKLRDITRRPPRLRYRIRASLTDSLSFFFLRRVSSSTLVIRHVQYDIGARVHSEQASRAKIRAAKVAAG